MTVEIFSAFVIVLLSTVGIFAAPKGTFKRLFDIKCLKSIRGADLGDVLLAWIFILGVGLFQHSVESIFIPELTPSEDLVNNTLLGKSLKNGFLFLFIVLLVPIFEEFTSRGYLLEAFKRLKLSTFGYVFSIVTFGLAHNYDFLGNIAFGLVTLGLRVRYASLVPPLALHVAHNLLCFLVLVCVGFDHEQSEAKEDGLLIYSIFLVSAAFLMLLGWRNFIAISRDVFSVKPEIKEVVL